MSGRLSLIVPAVWAAALSGCVFFQPPRSYPGGEPLPPGTVASPGAPYGAQPGQFDLEAPVAVTVRPQRTVAPVGSVVVLVAGVQSGDGYLRTNERLEWTMAPGSVGQFLAVEDNGWVDLLLGDFNRPRIVNNALAIGSTSRESVCLNRGTPCDNLCVLRGQSWITVASGTEGTSHITVFAPGVVCCDHRMEEAVIEWVRPQGPAGPPPIAPPIPAPTAAGGIAPRTAAAGNISVHKTGPASVAIGGTAAYRIEVSNPGGSLVGDVLLTDEVPENFTYLGSTPPAEVVGKRLQWRLAQLTPGERQTVELSFRAVQDGSVANCAEVTAAGGLKANDCVTTTVLAPVLDVHVEVNGPAEAAVGSDVTFEIVVTNRGQTTATGLTVKDRFDPGLEHKVKKEVIERTLPDLPPGRDVSLPVTFRVAQPGRLRHTVQIFSGGRVLDKKESWLTGVPAPGGQPKSPPGPPRFPLPGQPPAHEEPILPPPGLSVTVTGLHNAVTAGEEMTYYVAVKNHGSTPEHQVALSATVPAAMALAPLGTSSLPSAKYTYDNHVVRFAPIEKVGPGETLTYFIRVRAPQPGVFHFKVELSGRELAQPLHGEELTEVLQPPRESK